MGSQPTEPIAGGALASVHTLRPAQAVLSPDEELQLLAVRLKSLRAAKDDLEAEGKRVSARMIELIRSTGGRHVPVMLPTVVEDEATGQKYIGQIPQRAQINGGDGKVTVDMKRLGKEKPELALKIGVLKYDKGRFERSVKRGEWATEDLTTYVTVEPGNPFIQFYDPAEPEESEQAEDDAALEDELQQQVTG